MMTIDLASALARLNALAAGSTMEPWLDAVGQGQKEAVEARIRVEKADPDGAPWAPWRPYTAEYRHEKGNAERGLLFDEGLLLASILYKTEAGAVVIGTDVPYAFELQYGRRDMMARPFVGWSVADIAAIELSAVAYLEAISL